jgi:cytochrome c oxidase subunit 2
MPAVVPSGQPGAFPGTPIAWVIGGGIIMPAVVLTLTYALTLATMRAQASQPAQGVVIEIIGRQWWWEVRYPAAEVVTANEIHIPAGQPVTLQLTSADVIHSFWVPELNGKLDLNPRQTNTLILQADQPGEYRGQCAEFCGIQHAKMALLVIAHEPAEFEAWLSAQQQDAPAPADEATEFGQQVLLGSACVYCHTIRGTNASGVLGPDLTHLASRRTLAAATIPNTRGHLAGWIIDPQGIKPGNKMPPTDLGADELQALLAYLESLR